MIPWTFKTLLLMIICKGTTVPSLATWPLPLNVKNALLSLSQIFWYLVHSFCLNIFSVSTPMNLNSHEDGPSNSLVKAYIRPSTDLTLKKIALLNEWIHTCLSYLPAPKRFRSIWKAVQYSSMGCGTDLLYPILAMPLTGCKFWQFPLYLKIVISSHTQ